MSGQDITIAGPDGSFTAYFSPAKGGKGPGLVVIQEIFGVNQVMRGICDQFSAAGFTALCPDLFWRIEPGIQLSDQVPSELERAFELFGLYKPEWAIPDIEACLKYVRGHDACTGKAGTVGYCLGGLLAYLAATRTSTDASVGYYGVQIDARLNEAANIKKPLMLHIAEKDDFVSSEAQSAMKNGLSGNPLVTLYFYPDQDHAFARKGGDNYDAPAANLANTRSVEFFRANLS